MNISQSDLAAEYTRARRQWPFITDINDTHGMPPALLFALGSRETNLKNEIGDSGHGHGVFQLDDRSHQIPPSFDHDVRAQAQKAADMLVDAFRRFGDWVKACNYYNSGQPDTDGTAGGDYGPDVMQRQAYLATLIAPPPNGKPPWPLPQNEYFGLISGPSESHGGFYAWERRLIQERLQAMGFAPKTPGWADGIFEQPTKDAVAAWQRANWAGSTTRYGEVWSDDWARL